jgi:hypothetical protein
VTPGQIITGAQVAAALAVAVWAAYRGRWPVATACLALIWAVGLTRLFKAALPPDVAFVAWAALWVSVGIYLIRTGIAEQARAVAIGGGLCIGSGLMDAVGWLLAAKAALWSPPVLSADLLVFAALSALLWGASGGTRDRLPEGKRVAALAPGVGGIRGREVAGRSADMAAPQRREKAQ